MRAYQIDIIYMDGRREWRTGRLNFDATVSMAERTLPTHAAAAEIYAPDRTRLVGTYYPDEGFVHVR